jgi:hypothetical protein
MLSAGGVTNIVLLFIFIGKCITQQSSIQNDEKQYSPNATATNLKEIAPNEQFAKVQKCDSFASIGANLMCNGADWWKRKDWAAMGRLENQHPDDPSLWDDAQQAKNRLSLTSGLLMSDGENPKPLGSGVCHEKPGFYASIPGQRNPGRWFKASRVDMDCNEVCAEANSDSGYVNGELLAFDPVSMAHGGPKLLHLNTYSHSVSEAMVPTMQTSHYSTVGGTDYHVQHQHHECVWEASTNKQSYGASGHGPFMAGPGCMPANDFGDPKSNPEVYENYPGFYADAVNGCMDWDGHKHGTLSMEVCHSFCTCRDSYVDHDGKIKPRDVHTTDSYGAAHMKVANETRAAGYNQVLAWHLEVLKPINYYDSASMDLWNWNNPPAVGGWPRFPQPELLVEGSPAPELQLGYYCECPAGTYGKNCELRTEPCDEEHEAGEGSDFMPCIPENTRLCEHVISPDELGTGIRRCTCKDGWMGSTCAIMDMCHGRWGQKCVHGTCEFRRQKESSVKFVATPFFNYVLNCGEDREDNADGTTHNMGFAKNHTCAEFEQHGGCKTEGAIGWKDCCATCKREDTRT